MASTRSSFQPIWKKDAPLREERIALAKTSGIGIVPLLLSLFLLLWAIVDPQFVVLFWIAGISGLIEIVWVYARILPSFQKLVTQQKKAEPKGEENNMANKLE